MSFCTPEKSWSWPERRQENGERGEALVASWEGKEVIERKWVIVWGRILGAWGQEGECCHDSGPSGGSPGLAPV